MCHSAEQMPTTSTYNRAQTTPYLCTALPLPLSQPSLESPLETFALLCPQASCTAIFFSTTNISFSVDFLCFGLSESWRGTSSVGHAHNTKASKKKKNDLYIYFYISGAHAEKWKAVKKFWNIIAAASIVNSIKFIKWVKIVVLLLFFDFIFSFPLARLKHWLIVLLYSCRGH